jgi:hypothetical protein
VGTRGLKSADRWVWDPRLRVSQRGFAERAEAGAAPVDVLGTPGHSVHHGQGRWATSGLRPPCHLAQLTLGLQAARSSMSAKRPRKRPQENRPEGRRGTRVDQSTILRFLAERHDDDVADGPGGRPQAHCSLCGGGTRLLGEARAPGSSSVAPFQGGAWCTQVSTAPLGTPVWRERT